MNKYEEFDKALEDFAFMLADEMGLDICITGSVNPKYYPSHRLASAPTVGISLWLGEKDK